MIKPGGGRIVPRACDAVVFLHDPVNAFQADAVKAGFFLGGFVCSVFFHIGLLVTGVDHGNGERVLLHISDDR